MNIKAVLPPTREITLSTRVLHPRQRYNGNILDYRLQQFYALGKQSRVIDQLYDGCESFFVFQVEAGVYKIREGMGRSEKPDSEYRVGAYPGDFILSGEQLNRQSCTLN